MPLKISAFQELVLKRRALGIQKKKLGRLPKILHPTPIERQYSRALVAIAKNIQTQTEKVLLSSLEDVIAERDRAINKTDGVRLDGWADDADRLINSLKMTLENTVLYRPSRLAADIGQKTSAWNDVQWRKTMKAVMGVDFFQREPWLSDIMKSFEKENVGLIKSITDQAVNNIEGMVHRGVTNGDRFTKIQKQIQNQFDVTKNRARLIARDQVSKLNGQITMTRQTALGIEKYIWRTSLDERVRGNPAGKYPNSQFDHWEREGQTFSWNDPPPDGHPGQAIQCRCTAEPVLSELEDLVEEKPETEPAPAPEAAPAIPAQAQAVAKAIEAAVPEPLTGLPRLSSVVNNDSIVNYAKAHKIAQEINFDNSFRERRWGIKIINEADRVKKATVIFTEIQRIKKAYPKFEWPEIKTLHITKTEGGLANSNAKAKVAQATISDDITPERWDAIEAWEKNNNKHFGEIRKESHTAYCLRHEIMGHILEGERNVTGPQWESISSNFTRVWRKKNVSDYAGKYIGEKGRGEFFSDAFATYTSPYYSEFPQLPKIITEYFDKILDGSI